MRCWCTVLWVSFCRFSLFAAARRVRRAWRLWCCWRLWWLRWIVALIPHRLFAHVPGLRQIMVAEANTTGQTVLRLAMFLLATPDHVHCPLIWMRCSVPCGGSDSAYSDPPAALHMMTRRLEVVGFTFMIPLFFVVSGMGIDVVCRGG